MLLSLTQGFPEVSIGVFDEAVEERDEVVWIAFCYQKLSKRGGENSTIAIISSAIEEIREKSHNPLESSLILRCQSSHC